MKTSILRENSTSVTFLPGAAPSPLDLRAGLQPREGRPWKPLVLLLLPEESHLIWSSVNKKGQLALLA